MNIFRSISEAKAQGFVLAGPITYKRYRDCIIRGHGCKEANLPGGFFTLRVEFPASVTHDGTTVFSRQRFGRSVPVFVCANESRAGLNGASADCGSNCVLMFVAEDFARAIADACAFIDEGLEHLMQETKFGDDGSDTAQAALCAA